MLLSSLSLINIKTLIEPKSATQSILIVAPHSDDETLGCGGAIALLRQLDIIIKVLVVSDGTKSHPNSQTYPSHVLKKLREQESLAALNILGVTASAVTFWGMPDGAVDLSIQSEQAILLAKQYLKDLQPSIMFLPWRKDNHRDHRASWQLLNTASQNLVNSPRILEYPIWGSIKQKDPMTESINCWRLDISSVLELKQKAISQYRSQIGDLIDDDPQGFCLTPEMLQNFIQPWETYLEVSNHE
jgi:LmbE family N-acetylglucosaminyl deacetylase